MKPLKLLDRTLETLTAICFIGIIIVVLTQISTRFLPFSAVWTEELSRFLFIFAVCFGATIAMRRQEFISVYLILNVIPERFRNYYKAVLSLVVAATAFFIAYHGYTFMKIGQGQTSATMSIDMSYIHAGIGLSMIFVGFYSIINAYYFIRDRKLGEES
ncbi:TRAP-type C4-dicarboxylate transport system permease small subunit [Evansella vedderi]|uniref:TRAP-type C4-dicarboxylate transport system permease small subunit n=1 Tax=Evansella vedderi TaxID=38282 RepID=A0ABT9ZR44_9BACI|nr:TRAP transporter small permease subunit [Evansella vedderi]MDQ0252923.1 TRAP-type C4-dicarboxylate transport system permease small subunit [Evansella vedderi]